MLALQLERLRIWEKRCNCILFIKVFAGGPEVLSADPGIKIARYQYCISCLLGGHTLHLSELLSLLLLGGNCNKTFSTRLMLGVNGLWMRNWVWVWKPGLWCLFLESPEKSWDCVCVCVHVGPSAFEPALDCLLTWARSRSLLMFTRGVQSSDSYVPGSLLHPPVPRRG